MNALFNDKQSIESPCTSVCKMDADRRLCIGCLRTLDEIAAWRTNSDDAKRGVLSLIEQRKKTIETTESRP